MQHKLIYDRIHGNIELSGLETVILKSPYVNRLHQIIQNSTAYLVFPSCKTSRFEHSVGVMNYTSQLFLNGVRNSKYCQEYISEKTDLLLKNLLVNTEIDYFKCLNCDHNLSEILVENFGDKVTSIQDMFEDEAHTQSLIDGAFELLGKTYLERNLGYEYSNLNLNERFTFIVMFEAVRLFGLFHDVGHLPFSHLFEFSMEYLYENNSLKDEKLKKDLISLYEKPGSINRDAIHELIGKKIIYFIFNDLKTEIAESSEEKKKLLIKLIVIGCIELCLDEIRKAGSGGLSSLYGIVSSAVDSDRIDFVQRDGSVSGFSTDIGVYDRIIKLFYLTRTTGEKKKNDNVDNYLFLPAIQSLHDVEKLLHDRFKIYKYMVNHHSVKKFDYIYQVGIEQMFIDESSGKYTKGVEINKFIDVIEILTKLFSIDFIEDKNKKNEVQVLISKKFPQLTDYWLLSLFTKQYFKGLNGGSKNVKGAEKTERMHNINLLQEIYTNKRKYISLWKRVYNYHDFISKLGSKLLFKEIRTLISTLDQYSSLRDDVIDEQKRKLYAPVRKDEVKELLWDLKKAEGKEDDPKHVGKLIIKVLKGLNPNSWTKKIEIEANKNQLEYHILVARTKVSPGFDNIQLVDNKTATIIPFDELSELKNTLDAEIDSFIKFFVYFCPLKNGNGDINEERIKKDIDTVSDIILNTVVSLIRARQNEINKNIEKLQK